MNRVFVFGIERGELDFSLDWRESGLASRWKDLYTASYICVELLSVLFYPNYSLLLRFVKINIYHQSKYIILQYS